MIDTLVHPPSAPPHLPAPAHPPQSRRRSWVLAGHVALRVAAVLAMIAVLAVLVAAAAHAQPVPVPTPVPVPDPATTGGGPSNPFDGVKPDLGLFGTALNSVWKRVLAATWGACLAASAMWVLTSGLKLRKAKSRGMSSELSEGHSDWMFALVSLGAVALTSPIVGAVLFLVGNGNG